MHYAHEHACVCTHTHTHITPNHSILKKFTFCINVRLFRELLSVLSLYYFVNLGMFNRTFIFHEIHLVFKLYSWELIRHFVNFAFTYKDHRSINLKHTSLEIIQPPPPHYIQVFVRNKSFIKCSFYLKFVVHACTLNVLYQCHVCNCLLTTIQTLPDLTQ